MAERPTPGPWPHHSEGPQPQPESEASPLVPPMGERQRWSEASHEQLVQAFRNLIQREREAQRYPSLFPPAKIINYALIEQTHHWSSSDALLRQKAEFFKPIEYAWDALAYEHYQTEEGEELPQKHFAGYFLSARYQRAVALGEPRPEIFKLNPQQVKILDALAEAADIPHHRGQDEIAIPENLRYYACHRFGPDGKLII